MGLRAFVDGGLDGDEPSRIEAVVGMLGIQAIGRVVAPGRPHAPGRFLGPRLFVHVARLSDDG